MTTPCKRCGALIEYTPIPSAPGIVPAWCVLCGDQKVNQMLSGAQDRAAAEKAAFWASVCPAAYRLTSEGGITDMDRLTAECPVDWPEPDTVKPGMLITGNSGRGKTRWVWRAIRQRFDLGDMVMAFTPRSFEAASRDAEGTFKFKAFLDSCSEIGSFLLDDLGKASWSAKTLETFYEIIEQRASHLRPIFVTTNFTGNALAAQLKMDDGILEPLIRRLRENCRCIAV